MLEPGAVCCRRLRGKKGALLVRLSHVATRVLARGARRAAAPVATQRSPAEKTT